MSKKIDEVIKEYGDQRKKRFIKKIVITALIIIIILICVFLGYKFYKRNNILNKINSDIKLEYGEELTLDYILKDEFKKVKVSPKLNKIKSVVSMLLI